MIIDFVKDINNNFCRFFHLEVLHVLQSFVCARVLGFNCVWWWRRRSRLLRDRHQAPIRRVYRFCQLRGYFMKMHKLLTLVGLALVGLSVQAAPTSGAYITDPQSENTSDQAMRIFSSSIRLFIFFTFKSVRHKISIEGERSHKLLTLTNLFKYINVKCLFSMTRSSINNYIYSFNLSSLLITDHFVAIICLSKRELILHYE